MSELIILNKDFFDSFHLWLNFKLDESPTNIRYKDQFIETWSICFLPGLSFNQVLARLDQLLILTVTTTLKRWVKSLRLHFLYFVFSYEKGITIYHLCRNSNLNLKDFIFELRLFLQNQLINDSNKIDHYFLKRLTLESDWNVDHDHLVKEFSLVKNLASEINKIELILNKEVLEIFREIKNEFAIDYDPKMYESISQKISKKVRYVFEGVALIVFFFILSFVIQKTNLYWEKSLADKIKIFEPQFEWLKKGLVLDRENVSPMDKMTIKPKEFSVIGQDLSALDQKADRDWSNTESETVLSSLDIIPNNISETDYEISEYEEVKKRGYRDSRFGSTKVYRVVINSPDTGSLGDRLKSILNFYKTEKVDNVKPGQRVPGGKYYNIFVPRKFLKEFLSKVMDLGESFLYESRTRTTRNPPGQNKVFIWVKNI